MPSTPVWNETLEFSIDDPYGDILFQVVHQAVIYLPSDLAHI